MSPWLSNSYAALKDYPGEFELVFVDDGSTDRTLELLVEARKNHGDHIMHLHRRNLGQTQHADWPAADPR